ncbi:nuclear pore complex protein GP210 isoform X1 [Ricinus communis]|uniref:nuclear pore complex protein GP210 isoform X1 n=1 Tax=Ricinus communis TaxID=3988 RepID=UPI00201A9590|nr:nuclear pore complex protein GP210 isoform X1 [Ricinus communis]
MLCLRRAFLVVFVLLVAEKTASNLASGPHITDVNILLPPKMTHPVEYRLQGSDGCFKWSWDHHDILSVLPEYNLSSHCSTSARLRSIAPFSGRKETAVYAADVNSGIVIRCKVFIDNISRIQIFHNSIKLDLDGLATLQVRAFDSADNVFSSLVGLQFMWHLLPETGELPHHLAHVPLKESPLSDCGGLCGELNIQIKLEDSGVFSDLYVVKGVGIGHENVSVHLLEPRLKHMADKIVLTVAEAMSLEPPSPVYILIGAALQYSLKVIRGNIPQVVTLPSPYHSWSVSNSSVAEVNSMIGFARALNLGVTIVIVEDTRVADHVQTSSLNVVLPDSLHLYIIPMSLSGDSVEEVKAIPFMETWYVVSGRQYLIQIKVFSWGPDAHEIYITESDDLKLHNEQSDCWTIFMLSKDIEAKYVWQNSRVLRAASRGLGELKASLTYFTGHQETKEVIEVVQEIIVCDQVKFSLDRTSSTSQNILLPWAPVVYQEVELSATGGCAKASSDYRWFSSDAAIVSVSASGIVQAKKPGQATVRVVSIFDPFNYDEVVVEVSVPSSIIMLQNFPVETVVGSHVYAAVTMKASNGASFYSCDAFHSFIRWNAGSESFVVVNATEDPSVLEKLGNAELHSYGAPCSWTYIYASASGHTMLHATLSKESYIYDHSFHGSTVLKASTHIAAYPPLTVHQVGDGNQFGGYWFDVAHVGASNHLGNLEVLLYLVPGTSLDIILLGGPERWDKGVDFIETVEVLDEKHTYVKDGLHVHPVSGKDQSMYRVSCQTLGAFHLVFKRGNMVGDDHPLPAIAEVILSLTCSIPSSIALIVDEPVNSYDAIRTAALADRSTGKIHVTPITVANGQIIRIAAVGIDSSGEAFANSSSLSLKWELSSCEGLAYWDYANEAKWSRSSWERFLILQNESGECLVRASVIGFASHFSAKLPTLEMVLTDAIHLQIVSTLRVDPEFILLFFNPNTKANLSITGGSCFLEAAVNDPNVVEVIQSPPGLQCSQLTLSPKGLGTAVVTVYDIGLAPIVAASAVVQVAEVDWIKIVTGQEISLMEGQIASMDLVAGISDGRTFDPSQYKYMEIHVWIEDDIVELTGNNVSNLGGGYVLGPKFKIIAKDLGITTLYVSAKQQSGHEILSQPIKIEVYAPLRVHPQDIFLVPGSSYVLTVKGGPTIGVYVEYASLDDGIATVDRSSGQLSGISPGNTTILSTVYGNGDVVICQAYGDVKVGVPSSAMLNVQSEQLDVGRNVPIYPSFLEGDLFSIYELCKKYKWTVDDEKVLDFYKAGGLHGEKNWLQLNDEKELGFMKVLYGRSAGRTSVAVSFSCDFVSTSYSETRLYDASISLLVVPYLPLALGLPITWILPPHYITSSILPSSLESHGQWDGQSHKGIITYSLLRSCEKNEGWHKDAISIDGDRIKTMESNNLACIQGKDRTTGRVEIASCVRVAEVAQIRITNKEFPFHVIHVAVNTELDLSISYFDALGNPFYEAHNAVSYHAETNYHDIVSIDDTKTDSEKIHLKALRYGRALLRVSFKDNQQKSDFILISVGANIFPQNPVLHQGSSLHFSIEGSQVSGHWLSANESVISIDMPSGKAKAAGIGSTQVIFESPSMKLQTTVTVVSGNIVSVDAPKETLTNVPYPTKGYSFSVKFSDTCNKFNAVGNSKEISYDCKVDPPFVGYAKPWMNLETGNSYCLFFPYSPEHLVRSIPRLKDMRPYISVSINASLREASHISGSASALFIGGFSILEMDKRIMQLNLTPESNKSVLTILGNSDVDIQWHSRDVINIIPVHREDLGIGSRTQYEVKVLRPKRFKDKIIITLPANGQRVEIDVNYEPDARAVPKTIFKGAFLPTIVACFGAVLGIIFVFQNLFRMPNRTRSHTSLATQNITAPHTPERSSPVLSDQSPRTPQPFVDYVRRTIDETPFYKREARRRFNPQNTY